MLPRCISFTLSNTGDLESPMLILETPYDLLCCDVKTSNISNAQPLLVIIRPQLTMIIMSMTVLRNKLSRYIKSVVSGSSVSTQDGVVLHVYYSCYK